MPSKIIAAVDPGARGAIAILRGEDLIAVHDMPAVQIDGKARVSAAALADLLCKSAASHCYVERVAAMPKQGVASTFAFGYAAGIVEGVCAGLSVPVTFVTSTKWKRELRLTSDKERSRERALQLWPGSAEFFRLKKHHDRAEAALLGRWAMQGIVP